MSAHYFDTLPLHPQPEPLESFASYLTRLAEANGIWSLHELSEICFPDGQRGFTPNVADYPPKSFGALPTVAACPEPALLATTLYHLGLKFGRITRPQPLSQFLSGSLGPGLRYCPHCLAEHGYYSLVWRFLEVKGCPEHDCCLLDRCEHCGQKVPLLALRLKLGVCAACGGDLRTCRAESLSPSARQRVQANHRDFVFLLSPQPTETSERRMAAVIGEQLARWRQVRHLRIVDAADYIGQKPSIIYYIEGSPTHHGVKFQWYFEYADFLKVRFETLFEAPLPCQAVQTYEDKLVDKTQQAVVSLEQRGERATRQAICQMIGISVHAFSKRLRVRAICKASQAKWDCQHEAELVDQVHQAAKSLAEAGKRVTQKDIARHLGSTVPRLKTHPQVKEALKLAVEQMREGGEEKLLQDVQAALASLEAAGKSVSKQAIGEMLGMSTRKLDWYPKVGRFLVEQVAERRRERRARQFQQREQELVLKVQQAIETLAASGQPATRKAIHALIGRSQSGSELYPRVELLLREATLDRVRRRKRGRRMT